MAPAPRNAGTMRTPMSNNPAPIARSRSGLRAITSAVASSSLSWRRCRRFTRLAQRLATARYQQEHEEQNERDARPDGVRDVGRKHTDGQRLEDAEQNASEPRERQALQTPYHRGRVCVDDDERERV